MTNSVWSWSLSSSISVLSQISSINHKVSMYALHPSKETMDLKHTCHFLSQFFMPLQVSGSFCLNVSFTNHFLNGRNSLTQGIDKIRFKTNAHKKGHERHDKMSVKKVSLYWILFEVRWVYGRMCEVQRQLFKRRWFRRDVYPRICC